MEIVFAHRTFAWGSDAPGAAQVHVVIIGLSDGPSVPRRRRLFVSGGSADGPGEVEARQIGPYLVRVGRLEDPHLVVRRRRTSISGFPRIRVGSKPVDGGLYIMDAGGREEFLSLEPRAEKLVRPYVGGFEFINGVRRWILYPSGAPPEVLRSMPLVMERIRTVRSYRAGRGGNLARSLAAQPTAFHVTVAPTAEHLVIPEVSFERRD